MTRFFAGVDVGGTTTTVALGNNSGEILHISDQFPTSAHEPPGNLISTITKQIKIAVETIGASPADFTSVGLSTPGPATLDGVLHRTPNFSSDAWINYPIREKLEDSLRALSPDISVAYIGDGQAAALGEYAVRTNRIAGELLNVESTQSEDSLQSICMLVVGTGLGGGEVRNGQVVRGREGRAGHIGHMLLPEYAFRYEHDRQLLVVNAYCTVESAVSLTSLSHQLGYRLQLDEWKNHPLADSELSMKDRAKQLRNLVGKGDALAQQLFDDQAKALGIALLNVNYLGDYDLLVIGGGVCDLEHAAKQRYLRLAEESYMQHALDGFREHASFEYSICGDYAPVVGALYFAMTS